MHHLQEAIRYSARFFLYILVLINNNGQELLHVAFLFATAAAAERVFRPAEWQMSNPPQ